MKYRDLEFLVGQNVYMTCQPEVLDFTSKGTNARLVLCAGGKRGVLPLPHSKEQLEIVASLLKVYLDAGKYTILGWDVKSLFSFLRYYTEIDFEIPGRILDLKAMEAFCGHPNQKPPESYQEALDRICKLAEESNWDQLRVYYKNVAYPLISKAVPRLETAALVHNEMKRRLYAHYEIEGQANGRLRCNNAFTASYNPHTLSDVIKGKLNPSTNDQVVFVYLDFRHMEVSVLQWLSKDPALKKIMDSGRDLYEGIWEYVTRLECTESRRKICKSMFLPIVYGQGPTSVAQRAEISEKTAGEIIDRFHKAFPVAFEWVRKQQDSLDENQFAEDYFGRRRQFLDQHHRIRNFKVQAASNTICLHKLIRLFEQIDQKETKIIFHIHDGYGLLMHKRSLPKMTQHLVSILESEEAYYPGLRLRVSSRIGSKLDQLEKFEKEEGG